MMPSAYLFVAEDDWPEWIAINTDLTDDYTWLDSLGQIEKFGQDCVTNGVRPVQVDVRPAEFLAWCQAIGRDVNSQARRDYSFWRLSKLHREGNV